jgi:hypothetical protein
MALNSRNLVSTSTPSIFLDERFCQKKIIGYNNKENRKVVTRQ